MERSPFTLWGKWFWIGMVSAVLNPLIGVIYGIGVAVEKDTRKEGLIITVWSILIWVVLAIAYVKYGGTHITPVQPQQ